VNVYSVNDMTSGKISEAKMVNAHVLDYANNEAFNYV
jgi:hypothetical protein